MKQTTKWNRDNVRAILQERDEAVLRGLTVINRLQTQDERAAKVTTHSNGVGWSGFDAEIMGHLAEWYEEKGFLTEKQLGLARRKMLKYAGQLARVANGEVEVSAA